MRTSDLITERKPCDRFYVKYYPVLFKLRKIFHIKNLKCFDLFCCSTLHVIWTGLWCFEKALKNYVLLLYSKEICQLFFTSVDLKSLISQAILFSLTEGIGILGEVCLNYKCVCWDSVSFIAQWFWIWNFKCIYWYLYVKSTNLSLIDI